MTDETRRIRRHRIVLKAGTALSVAMFLFVVIVTGPFSRITLLCLVLGIPAWATVGWAFHVLNTTSKGGPE